MVRGEYKKVLWEVFGVLDFFEHEKERALEGFKKKFANALLMEIRDCMSDEQKQWIAKVATDKQYDKSDPKVVEIQQAIDSTYSKEEFNKVSREVFKKILSSYVNFMSQKMPEKSSKLNGILSRF